MQLKYILSTTLVIIFSLIFYRYVATSYNNHTNDVITFGIAAGYAPFVSINERCEYEGFDIDVARLLGLKLNKKVVFKDLGSMTSLIIALNQGKIDAIMWGMSITQDRLKNFALIHYQGERIKSYPLLFWNSIPEGITPSTLNGLVISVEPSSAQSTILERYENITILPTDKVDDALINLQYGKSDAALVESAIAKKFRAKFPHIKILNIPLQEAEQENGIGIVLKKNNTELINQLTSAVAELKESGSIKELEQKWDLA